MIFLTVGTQLPFDRLAQAVDEWCVLWPEHEVIGQIGEPGRHGYHPTHFEWWSFIDPSEFMRRFDGATAIVAHAGMGSIITALLHAKPIVIMPRRGNLGEHRNDHQYATAKAFANHALVQVAMAEDQLPSRIEMALMPSATAAGSGLGRFAESSLIDAIRMSIITAPERGSSKSSRP